MYGRHTVAETLRWHDMLPVRRVIDQRTSPVDEQYLLVFGTRAFHGGGRSIETGYTDFSNRRCWVNTEYLSRGTPEEQYVMTMYLAAHERAHARWTDFVEGDFHLRDTRGDVVQQRGRPVFDLSLHHCWNILEDERIERLITREFHHLHGYLRMGCRLFLGTLDPVTGADTPGEVLNWVLRSRVAARGGISEPCPLSPHNRELLDKITPHLDSAFGCDSARTVVQEAREILKILELDTQVVDCAVLSGMMGQRRGDDEAESEGATAEEGTLPDENAGKRAEQTGGNRGLTPEEQALLEEVRELLGNSGYSPGTWSNRSLTPAPYIGLMNSVREFVAPLRRLFDLPPKRPSVAYEALGSRLSVRAARRTPLTPFRADGEVTRRAPVSLTIIIDDSGSMQLEHRAEEAKRAAMLCLGALPNPHQVRIVLAPSGRVVADRSLPGDLGKANLAGYDSNSGTEYASLLRREAKLLTQNRERRHRYLILVADGVSGEPDLRASQTVVSKAAKSKINVIGVGVRLDPEGNAFYEQLFGAHYLTINNVKEFVPKFATVLRKMARLTQQ